MVLQRRLDYGFNGCQVLVVPRRPRSARGKRSARKKVTENQMCAFELLATVAGKLLLEENPPAPINGITGYSKPAFSKVNVKEEQQDEGKPFKVGPCDQGSCHEGDQGADVGFQRQARAFTLKECSQASSSAGLAPRSTITKPDPSEEVASAEESVFNRNNGEFGRIPGTIRGKFNPERQSPVSAGSYQAKVVDGIPSPLQFEGPKKKHGFHGEIADPCCVEEPMKVDLKPHLLSSESSVEVPLHGDHQVPHSSSFANCGHDMVHCTVDRDDDEKSSGCTQPCYVPCKSSRAQRIGDRRIRKLLVSKFWKVGPTLLKDEEFSNTDEKVKPAFRSRKMGYTRQRTQRCSFKRRKLFERGLLSTSVGTVSDEGKGASSSVTDQKTSFESDDYRVKLSIKSFKVPELFIELPETATVGSLKRTVVEAVTAVLCGGFRVGVLLQGKKLRDDNKTLLQAGISHGDKLDSLGFALEPKPSQSPNKLTANTEDAHFRPVCDGPQPPKGLPAVPASDAVMLDSCTDLPTLATSANCVESDHDSAPSPPDTTSAEKSTPNSKALVVVPAMEVEALAVVPFHRTPRRAETAPRRIRRPFSVSEVEALVQAVERLGTGRWRDVKLRAFENAKHRTYVDLKDKWKTLVHTAKISPQQRRGEPVPQELLDRVLSANAYWSQHQAKLQVKQPQGEPLLLA